MIKLIALDADGTLCPNDIVYTSEGGELKSFSVKDGLGIASWIKLGKKVAIITGRESSMVQRRTNELGIHYLYQNTKDKGMVLKEIANIENISLEEIAVIGDDMNDLKMINLVKLSFCPSDASKDIKNRVTKVLDSSGGNGAVREMIDYLIEIENLKEAFFDIWK